jgi:D-alanyl-D-alanine dipeptidase
MWIVLSVDRGQAAPLALVVLLVGGGVMLLVAELARAAVDRAEATTAADAAALAGAADGPLAAQEMARVNGGVVVELIEDGVGMTVTVLVGEARATARAERRRPSSVPGRVGLTAAMLAAISRAEQVLGHDLTVVSGFRSRDDQQRLWDQRAANPFPVAPPGTSRHESGEAIDVAAVQVAELRRVGPEAGLCTPLPATDPVHFELCRWNPN